jgi:hypothetical protein
VEEPNSEIAKLKQKVKQQRAQIKLLKAEISAFPLQMWLVLIDILQDKKSFFYPDLQKLKVKDLQYNNHQEIELKASDIVSVLAEPKSRRKFIYVDLASDGNKYLRVYVLNNNELNFSKLALFLDPLSHRLVQISKSAIVNVAYYDVAGKEQVILARDFPELAKMRVQKVSPTGMKEFQIVKNAFNYNISLQKRIGDYKNTIGGFSGT